MSKPFSGKIPFPNPDGTTTLQDNTEFFDTLTLSRRIVKKNKHIYEQYWLTDSAGRWFRMYDGQIDDFLGPPVMGASRKTINELYAFFNASLRDVTIKGLWTFVKVGSNFGLKLVSYKNPKKSNKLPKSLQAVPAPTPTPAPAPAPTTTQKRNLIAICLDKSGSMSTIPRHKVVTAYNDIINQIQEQAHKTGQETYVSTFMFGGGVFPGRLGVPAHDLKLMMPGDYKADGGNTPLFECLGKAMESLSASMIAFHPDTSFLVYCLTDGEENASHGMYSPGTVNKNIQKAQQTDRWTFAIQVPEERAKQFIQTYAIPAGNVQGWKTDEAGLRVASMSTVAGVSSYFSARSTGARSVQNIFTTDLSKVSLQDLKAKLKDLTGSVKFWKVDKEQPIKEFFEEKHSVQYVLGSGWYQLTKTEVVQPYKEIAIRVKGTKEVYGGPEARRLIGVDPALTGNVKVIPGNHAGYDIFVMSTSVNRKLVRGTEVMFLPPTNAVPETWDSKAAKAAADAKKAAQPQ